MVEKAKEYFLFLTQLYGIKPGKAKEIIDDWFKDHQINPIPSEFNKWYYENYPSIKNHNK